MRQANHLGDPQQTLQTLRLIWGAMLAGIVTVFVILTQVVGATPLGLFPYLSAGAWGVLVIGGVAGYFVRMEHYKSGWRGHAVTPEAYASGNIILFAFLEGGAMMGNIAAFIEGPRIANIAAVAVAVAVLVVNFPTGRAMEGGEGGYRMTNDE